MKRRKQQSQPHPLHEALFRAIAKQTPAPKSMPLWLDRMDLEGCSELEHQGPLHQEDLAYSFQGETFFDKLCNWNAVVVNAAGETKNMGAGQIINQLRYLRFHCPKSAEANQMIENMEEALRVVDAKMRGSNQNYSRANEYFAWFPRMQTAVSAPAAPVATLGGSA